MVCEQWYEFFGQFSKVVRGLSLENGAAHLGFLPFGGMVRFSPRANRLRCRAAINLLVSQEGFGQKKFAHSEEGKSQSQLNIQF